MEIPLDLGTESGGDRGWRQRDDIAHTFREDLDVIRAYDCFWPLTAEELDLRQRLTAQRAELSAEDEPPHQ